MKQMMSAMSMEAVPECQAGAYSAAPWFLWIATMINTKYPGAGDLLVAAADYIPWTKLWGAIQTAYADLAAGKDFLTALKDALSQFVTIQDKPDGPVMMSKPA